MDSYRFITLELNAESVAVLSFNRPEKLNALSIAMLNEISAALDVVPSTSARALVITGIGRAFSSGAALVGDDGGRDLPEDLGALLDEHHTPIIERLFAMPVPIVTAVNGAAAGAGCSIALCGDIIIASRSAYFLQAFANIGLVPDAGSSWLLPRAIGRARAMEMMLLGERIPSERALAWGMINRLAADAELMPEAMALARRLAEGPTLGFSLMRQLEDRSTRHWPKLLPMSAMRNAWLATRRTSKVWSRPSLLANRLCFMADRQDFARCGRVDLLGVAAR